MLYGEDRSEDRSLEGILRKAAVVQVALNRAIEYGTTDVCKDILKKSQFRGYNKHNPVEPWAIKIVNIVCDAWELEHSGEENVWRVLPNDYLYFGSTTGINRFRNEYKASKADFWSFDDTDATVIRNWLNFCENKHI